MISVSKAAKLLAERDGRSTDAHKSAKNPAYQRAIGTIERAVGKWKGRIENGGRVDAVEEGELPSPDGGKNFLIEEFVGWARSLNLKEVGSLDDKFKGFPAIIRISGTATFQVPTVEFSMTRQITAPRVPAPREWVDALERVNREWVECQKENEDLRAELERLRPLAEAKVKEDETRRTNARKTRKEDSSD